MDSNRREPWDICETSPEPTTRMSSESRSEWHIRRPSRMVVRKADAIPRTTTKISTSERRKSKGVEGG
ncbi:hypothetical protein A2U01_0024502 [Trifolium medium]|uniref:Uncharacterized protein n=1 Tax=Trifolium medium TaxID=97028 RepID=A0A392NVI8_9FABA|nr:hypothetical protein [Trifolium medium]